MPSAGELRKIYPTLDRDEKLIFLDGLVELLQRHEDAKASAVFVKLVVASPQKITIP